jgi:phosphate:Na+ symporter
VSSLGAGALAWRAVISSLLGGIGLFLLGMAMMAEGLKSAAGGALRDLLARYTGGPLRALASGAALTALIQSSSATTVMTIGFVSAGLLGFPQAVGVIFGAAIGTTSTAWMVAFLGLKYSVSILALPLVGIGAFLHLLTRGRTSSIGFVIAGFGLIFVGIDTLQAGMVALSDRVDFAGIPADFIGGRILLVLAGAAMTVIMQSSSAAVATTLAAVHAGTVDLGQAASLVIGQSVGTTVTALIASIGASVPARRTAMAHVLLNASSGGIALLALPLYLRLLGWLAEALGLAAAEQIALFHTMFTVMGVALLLPASERYSALIARLVPDPGPRMTRFLDASVRSVPPVAVEAARRTVVEITREMGRLTRRALGRDGALTHADRDGIQMASAALGEVRSFLGGIRSSPEIENDYNRHLSVLHAIDHMERMVEAMEEMPDHAWRFSDRILESVAREAYSGIGPTLAWLAAGASLEPAPDLEPLSREIADRRRNYRTDVMAWTASGQVSPQGGLSALDTMRWIDRIVYHLWRATYHLSPGGSVVTGRTETFGDPTLAENADVSRRETP